MLWVGWEKDKNFLNLNLNGLKYFIFYGCKIWEEYGGRLDMIILLFFVYLIKFKNMWFF